VHEAQFGVRQKLVHQPHFAKRSDVIMGNSSIPQQLQQSRRGIGLYGVQRLALKLLGEETGSTSRSVRAKERDRFVRAEGADYSQCVRIFVQLKGPPKNNVKQQGCLAVIGSPPGAAEGAYKSTAMNVK
jgi:hypothetical protein